MSMGEAMKKVGYSKEYSENPPHLKNTASWQALLNKEVKDEDLTKALKKLIKHKEWRANDAGLTHAFKLKSRYAPEQHEVKVKRDIGEVEDEIAETLSEIGGIVSGEGRDTGE